MELREFIKNKRLELGLTLGDVANACNVSEATVSRWENGHIDDMRRSRIAALANVLHISPIIILNNDNNNIYDATKSNIKDISKDNSNTDMYTMILNDSQLGELVNKASKLSPRQIEHLLRIVETFEK